MRAKPKLPTCPICGAELRKVSRGATEKQYGQRWVCRVAEAEVYVDEAGRTQRIPDAKHPSTHVWSEDELLPPPGGQP